MRSIRSALTLAIMLACASSLAWVAPGTGPDGSLFGAPPVVSFRPDIPYFPRNFAIAQDVVGRIYVGSTDGVLTFDGARWRLVELPDHEAARSLVSDGAARVYVGGHDLIGWLEPDGVGAMAFHDLTSRAKALADGASLAEVHDVFVFPEGVLFVAQDRVVLFDPSNERMRTWSHRGRFGIAWRDPDGIVLQFRGEGFKRLVGEMWTAIPGGATDDEAFIHAIPMPDGGRLLGGTRSSWRQLREGRVAPAILPPGLPSAARVTKGVVLADGSVMLAGVDGVLHAWDPRHGVVRHHRTDDERIADVVPARDGGLLIAGGSLLHHMQWPAAWVAVGAEVGLRGSIRSATRWEGQLYALTSDGPYRLDRDAKGEVSAIRQPWTDAAAWDLMAIDAHSALLAASDRLLLVEDGRVRAVSHDRLHPRVLRRSRFDPDLVLVGTERGLALARRDRRGWTIVAERDDLGEPSVDSIVETAEGEVWLGTARSGAIRAVLDADRRAIVAIDRFGAAQGLAHAARRAVGLARLPDGHLIASTDAGLFGFTGDRFVADQVDGLAALRPTGSSVGLSVAPDATLWAWTRDRLWRRAPDGGWRSEDVATILRGAIDHVGHDGDRAPIVFTTGGLLFPGDGRGAGNPDPPRVLLTEVSLSWPGYAGNVELARDRPHQVPEGGFTLGFHFALPEFRRAGSVRYRGRMLPDEREISDWSTGARYFYSNLRPGRYRFEVEARDADGTITAIDPYEFEVTPRWHNTPLARLMFGLALLLTIGIATRFVVMHRTAWLAAANRRLELLAHLDGLTGIANRRRLDGYLASSWASCRSHRRPLAVLAIDVDRFKAYNDAHGHIAGDRLLQGLGSLLAGNLRRAEDLAARYGGEEFMVVLPGADAEVARQVAEALRRAVAGSGLGATISVGVASETPREDREVAALVAAADAALYRAKTEGRDRVIVAGG